MKFRYWLIIPVILIAGFTITGCERMGHYFAPHISPFEHPENAAKRMKRFAERRVERIARELELSETQMEKLRNIQNEIIEMHRKNREKEGIDHKETMDKIVMMIRSDSITKEQILDFMKKQHSCREEMRKELDDFTAEKLVEVHSVFTEEQRNKLAEKIESFKPPFERHRP